MTDPHKLPIQKAEMIDAYGKSREQQEPPREPEAPDIPLCGEPAPGTAGLKPCIREPGHEGTHYWWTQAPWNAAELSGTWGVQIFEDREGGDNLLHTRYQLETKGPFSAEEAAAMAAYMDLVAEARAKSKEEDASD